VVALYTNSGARDMKHEWIKAVDKVGLPSYVMIRVFRPSHGLTYSSLACPSLEVAAYMQIPATHVLFSFVASSALLTKPTLGAAHHFELVTLCPLSAMIMRRLRERSLHVSACARASQKSRKGSNLNAECKGNSKVSLVTY
ncbi:hypothetical protein PAXRUDRAFT_152138, partial [Paxillus rubicundulus Ve08.2h10]